MVVIASGIVIMNLFSKMGSEEGEKTPAQPPLPLHLWTKISPTNGKGIAYV
jgi:small multidrug resistance pump